MTGVSPAGDGYELTLENGETLRARQVVVAVGVEHFAYLPEQLAGLPAGACTHSSAHTDLAAFAGQRVTVVGAGQSALESAALLHEHGAQVQIVMRKEQVVWNGAPLAPDRPLLQRLREPEAGLWARAGAPGSTPRKPGLFRHLPESTRVSRARTALGPAGASWLRGRVEGEFPVLTGQALDWAVSGPEGVRLGLVSGSGARMRGGRRPRHRGHRVPAGPEPTGRSWTTGCGPQLRTVAGTPVVGRDYQTSAPGLYVVGPGVAPTFGPVMRFVYGADHAARTVGRALAGAGARRADVAVGAGL